jgi:tRNA (guanine37-N1)-methyltransferase
MKFDLFTLFPQMFEGPFRESIIRRGQEAGLLDVTVHDIRDWTHDRHRTADDRPYGGGAGMVLMAPPIVEAVESVVKDDLDSTVVLLMSASGVRFNQAFVKRLASAERIAIICGHYEGVDQRVVDILNAKEVSIGDYVLTGGEIPAMVVVDAVSRLVPGVIDPASIGDESHEAGLLEYPHYTRPAEYRGLSVPDILLSGHHANVEAWRRQAAIDRTHQRQQQPRGEDDNDATRKTVAP